MRYALFVFSCVATALIMLGACGKVDTPPGPLPPPISPINPKPPVVPPIIPPNPKTTFVVNGVSIEIEGTVKNGASTSVDRAESAVKTAVSILER